MGIVGPPIKGKSTGKIMMRRVCVTKITKSESYNQNFSPYFEQNNRLKLEEWKQLVPSNGRVSVANLLDQIKYKYKIPPHIAKDLVFVYKTHWLSPRAKNLQSKQVKIGRSNELLLDGTRKLRKPTPGNNKNLVERKVKVDDLELHVNVPKGREVIHDVNCDSQFMIDVVNEIGRSVRQTYSFVPKSEPVFLFMYNAGRHGKKHIKEQYVKVLKDNYNVEIVWQIPNSPETNMLDLGTWLCLQLKVEVQHKKK